MNQIKISIIMPIHNTGEYLRDALETIFTQSYQAFELICVDDLSSDELTKNILCAYQNRHKNMQVIWLENNVGAGVARNIGFSKVKGEYTVFLDADDMFATDFLEKMYQCIDVKQADVCICGYEEFYIDNGQRHSGNKYIPNDYKIYFDNREDWLLNIPMAPWNKLCRTQFLKENQIYFQSLTSCNDVYFSCMVMMTAKEKCYIADTPLIFYRINSNMQISSRRNPVDLYKAVILVKESKKDNINDRLSLQWINALLLQHGISIMKNCYSKNYNLQFYNLLKQNYMKHSITFQNSMLSLCIEVIKNNSYEDKWIQDCTDFLCQLHFTAKKLKERLIGEKQIFLWGLGYRGRIFEKFCKEQEIVLQGVADIKNYNIESTTDCGNKIVSTEYVLHNNGLIIATNGEIYRYLQMITGNYKKKIILLNLAEFYAF